MDDDEQPEGNNDNVVVFGRPTVVATSEEQKPVFNLLNIPRDYIITDIDNMEWFGSGFLVFSPEHIAIMKMLDGGGAVPVVVLPIGRVKAAELYEEDTEYA